MENSRYEKFAERLRKLGGFSLDFMPMHGAKKWTVYVWLVRGKNLLVLDMGKDGFNVFIPSSEDSRINSTLEAVGCYLGIAGGVSCL